MSQLNPLFAEQVHSSEGAAMKPISFKSLMVWFMAALTVTGPLSPADVAGQEPAPIIDMHLHAATGQPGNVI